jgi:hypothetical protein
MKDFYDAGIARAAGQPCHQVIAIDGRFGGKGRHCNER